MDYYKIATIILSVIVFFGMINRYCLTRSNNEALESMQKNINHNATAFNLLVEQVDTLEKEFDTNLDDLEKGFNAKIDDLEEESRKSRERIWHELEQLLRLIRHNDEEQRNRFSRDRG